MKIRLQLPMILTFLAVCPIATLACQCAGI